MIISVIYFWLTNSEHCVHRGGTNYRGCPLITPRSVKRASPSTFEFSTYLSYFSQCMNFFLGCLKLIICILFVSRLERHLYFFRRSKCFVSPNIDLHSSTSLLKELQFVLNRLILFEYFVDRLSTKN